MLTQAEEEMEAAPDRQEETTTLVMVKKKKKNLFLKILDTHQKWDQSAEEVECKQVCIINGLQVWRQNTD